VGGTQGDSWQNGKIPFTMQPVLTINYPLCLSLSYRQIPSWDTVMKLAYPSNIMAVDTKCCATATVSHVIGTHCHLDSNPPYAKNTKPMHTAL